MSKMNSSWGIIVHRTQFIYWPWFSVFFFKLNEILLGCFDPIHFFLYIIQINNLLVDLNDTSAVPKKLLTRGSYGICFGKTLVVLLC